MYQTNLFSKCRRKRIEYVDCWVKPPSQSLVTAPRLFELVDLVLNYSHNVRRRVACLKLARERMSEKILLGLLFICFEGIV